MVEIAMTSVNLGKKDKGLLYKFVYEVIPPRHMRQNPALIANQVRDCYLIYKNSILSHYLLEKFLK